MELGNAFGVSGCLKGPLGLVTVPGRVFFSSYSQLYVCGQEVGRVGLNWGCVLARRVEQRETWTRWLGNEQGVLFMTEY